MEVTVTVKNVTMISFTTILILWTIWSDIKVKCDKQDLDVWSRDPRFDFRRNAISTKNDLGIKKGAKAMFHRIHAHLRPNLSDNIKSTRMTPMYLMQQDASSTTDPADVETTTGKDKSTRGPSADDFSEDNFYPVLSSYAIRKDLEDLIKTFPDVNITLEVLDRTVSYYDIILLRITEGKSEMSKYFRAREEKYIDEVPEKKIIFIVHALSVMGWNSLRCLHNRRYLRILMSYYFRHLDKFDIYLIPMANPDGTDESKQLWNKNLSPQGACSGVALDRNFDVAWNASRRVSSCSQQYPGETPFSEVETRAIRKIFHQYSHKIVAYIHVHSGTYASSVFKGDAVLYPRGYTEAMTDDDKYIDLRGEIDEAMRNATFRVYSVTVDTLYNWYGKVSGTSVDYAATVYGIPYAMEFVMQLYNDDPFAKKEEEKESYIVLTEVWRRVIDVVFYNIDKSLHYNDVNQ